MLKYQILPQLPEPWYWTLLKDQLPNQSRAFWAEDFSGVLVCVEVNLYTFQHKIGLSNFLSYEPLWVGAAVYATNADWYHTFYFVFIENASSSS